MKITRSVASRSANLWMVAFVVVMLMITMMSPQPQRFYCQARTTAFVVAPRTTTRNPQVYISPSLKQQQQQRHHAFKPLHAVPALPMELLVSATAATISSSASSAVLAADVAAASSSSSMSLSASTVDPTTFLQDLLGGVLGTPLILAIPIVAALGVATLIAFAIVSYASPAEPEDE